jgi:hypothetical protein
MEHQHVFFADGARRGFFSNRFSLSFKARCRVRCDGCRGRETVAIAKSNRAEKEKVATPNENREVGEPEK